MDDRRMLELAAKAAGIDAKWCEWKTGRVAEFGCIKYEKRCGFRAEGTAWSPLTDDGDALRLAVKLRLVVCTPVPWFVDNDDHFYCCAKWIGKDGHEDWRHADFKVSYGGDAASATRLAITRAAAAIGEQMEVRG